MNHSAIKSLNLNIYTYNESDRVFSFDKKNYMVKFDHYNILSDYIKIVRLLKSTSIDFEELENRFIKIV